MAKKSVVGEARQIQMAIELINLGARLQVLEAETTLSRERLLRLYKEVKGVSPPTADEHRFKSIRAQARIKVAQ